MKKTTAGRYEQGPQLSIAWVREAKSSGTVFFRVSVRIQIGGHHISWQGDLGINAAMIVEVDDQLVRLLTTEDELLVDSSGTTRTFAIHLEQQHSEEQPEA